jgi:hypothetical protein
VIARVVGWRGVLLVALVCAVLGGCAPKGDNDNDNDDNQRGGFYGGVSGGLHP